MRTRVLHIGVLDDKNSIHQVEFHAGLNLVTGKSSTGKSSILEIFDYCMGSDEDTIPSGIIKNVAKVFFVDIIVDKARYIFGREYQGKHYIKKIEEDLPLLTALQFTKGDERNFETYKVEIGLLFGLTMEDTAESLDDKKRRGMKGRPSIRNVMSFVLQHQSLIANKLALFYRFDEKEKREQTIDQFKIFSGIVDAKYFAVKIELENIRKRLKTYVNEQEAQRHLAQEQMSVLDQKLQFYKKITGNDLFQNASAEDMLSNPSFYIKSLNNIRPLAIVAESDNDNYQVQYKHLLSEQTSLQCQLREVQIEINKVDESISQIEAYQTRLSDCGIKSISQNRFSECPFCHQQTPYVENEIIALQAAMDRVKSQLVNAVLLRRPQYNKREQLIKKLETVRGELSMNANALAQYKDIIDNLKNQKSLQEQAYMVVASIIAILETFAKDTFDNEEVLALQKRESQLVGALSKYNVTRRLQEAEIEINDYLKDYQNHFNFESTLDNFHLSFNLSTFEIEFQKGQEKIKLRSLGSGANWLSVHLCLFLAISKYFFKIPKSAVPSVLFLDQPSQVYFPSTDKGNDFQLQLTTESKDQDLKDVESVFSNLYSFCSENQGFQIIVIDHADKLHIQGLNNFEDIVVARWREEGQGLISEL